MEKIEKLKTEISNIYGERLSFDHWEELEYSVIDEIGLKVNEIIDRLNEQPEEECEHEIPTCLGIAIGDIGLSLYGEPPEKGYRCAKCGEYISERDKDATIEYLYKVIKEKEQELDKARVQGMIDEWGRIMGDYAYEDKGDGGVFKGELRMSESDIKKEYKRLDKISKE